LAICSLEGANHSDENNIVLSRCISMNCHLPRSNVKTYIRSCAVYHSYSNPHSSAYRCQSKCCHSYSDSQNQWPSVIVRLTCARQKSGRHFHSYARKMTVVKERSSGPTDEPYHKRHLEAGQLTGSDRVGFKHLNETKTFPSGKCSGAETENLLDSLHRPKSFRVSSATE
jgi:hypothetical protein